MFSVKSEVFLGFWSLSQRLKPFMALVLLLAEKCTLKLCQLISSVSLLKAPAEILQILQLLQYLQCMCDELFFSWLLYSSFHVQRCPWRLSSPTNL